MKSDKEFEFHHGLNVRMRAMNSAFHSIAGWLRLEWTSGEHVIQPPCTQSKVPRAMSRWLRKVSKRRPLRLWAACASAPSLHSTAVFPLFRGILLCFNLCPWYLVLAVGATEKSLALVSWHLPYGSVPMNIWLFQVEQSQLSQPILIEEMVQFFHYFGISSPDSLQYAHISLILGGPELDPAL